MHYMVKSSLKNKLSSIFVACCQKTIVRLRRTSDFVFRGQKPNDHLGTNLKILYFVIKERMAVSVQFSKFCISL